MNFPINTTAMSINNASTAERSDIMVIRNRNTPHTARLPVET